MLILLPPSETKRPGGSGMPLDTPRLALSTLSPLRERVTAALVELSSDAETAARVLKLSERQHAEIEVNARLREAPTMPAVDRYTGVLYDALGAETLDVAARRWVGRHVMIHTAPWGPVGALEAIPAYRLGAAASIPGIPALRRLWADAVTAAIEASAPAFVLDLRSEAYVALGPLPHTVPQAYVRVVTAGGDGAMRALNHFNKQAKGALVRRLARERPSVRSRAALLRWTKTAGVEMRPSSEADELHLVV